MKTSFNWLKEFIKTNKRANEIAELLTLSGAEVGSIKKHQKDYILDIDITPNRGDELSVLGIAREVAALTGTIINYQLSIIKESKIDLPLTVDILDSGACPRFTCRIIDNIKIKPSPKWIIDRLESYGFRPINNIVDITNLVMIELGQPLHAFDYDKISGHKMIIRRAKTRERVKTLDGLERILGESAIIIEDAKNLIDLAGIMGGELSEISQNSKTIILEAAIFNPVLIRKTSKEQALTTDASYRFERGIDQDGQIRALNRATELILKYALGEAGEIIDIKKIKFKPKEIKIDLKKISSLLGIEISEKEAEKYLESLGFKCHGPIVEVPSWRNDISIWQDVAEEIIRIKGYNSLKAEPLSKEKPKNKASTFGQKEILKDKLTSLGLSEIFSYNFLSSRDLEIFKRTDESLYQIENPVDPENRYLRDSLFPSFLRAITKNPTYPEIKIFEIGKVFNLNKGERTFLGIALAGDKAEKIPELIDKINRITLSNLKWQTKMIDEEGRRRYKIKKKFVVIAEANLTQFLDNMPMKGGYELLKNIDYREISKFPSITRDLAFLVDSELPASKLLNTIKTISPLIVSVELFDEFESNKFGQNKKSLAYHLEYQAKDKTLTTKEGDELSKKIVDIIKNKFKAELRDK